MFAVGELEVIVLFAVFSNLVIWALFWVIWLAVRYGTNDALRMHREWISARDERDDMLR